MGKVRNPVASNAPPRDLHLVPTGTPTQRPGNCIRCGLDLMGMSRHYTDDAAVVRMAINGPVLLQLDAVDAAYNFKACRARS